MNFRLRDKSKAKIRNYQINFAASLQIPSPNRKITDRNRPSNSPPPRSLRNNRHTVPYRPVPFSLVPSSLVPFLLSCLVLSCPVLSCPVLFLSRPISIPSYFYPVLSCRPLRPVPDQTVFASEATTTHTPIRPARVQPSAPRGPFPKSNPVPASAPVGTASSRPASHPHETRSAMTCSTTGPPTAYNKIPPPEIPAGVSSLSQNRHVAENPHKKCHRSSIAERRPAWRGDEHVKNDKNEASLPSLKHFKLQTLRKYLLRHCAHGAHNAPESPESAATLHTVLPCRTLPTRTRVPCNRRSLRLPSPDRPRTRP